MSRSVICIMVTLLCTHVHARMSPHRVYDGEFSLRDPPIAGQEIKYLSGPGGGHWTADTPKDGQHGSGNCTFTVNMDWNTVPKYSSP